MAILFELKANKKTIRHHIAQLISIYKGPLFNSKKLGLTT